jgi:hypothetical protein
MGPTGALGVDADEDNASEVADVADSGTGLDNVASGGAEDVCIPSVAFLQALTLASSSAAVSNMKRRWLVVTGSSLLIG